MLPVQKEFMGPPDEFGQRTRIRCNLALKGQAVTAMQPSPAKTYAKKGLDQGEVARPDRAAA